jgi:TonB-linked SusC/RagA family outer membrane protein
MKKFLLLCFSFVFALSTAWAQERTISGKVSASEDGSALPGVNVVLKGTTNGTVTDSDGNYKLNVPSSGGTLVFSFIGLQTQEVEIGDRSVLDMPLSLDVKQLNEVVVTAQGIQQDKRALGYSVSQVSGSVLEQKGEQDIGRLLSGKMSGVNITATGGAAGTGTNIIIRGYTTVSGSKQPLFIVDGVPFNADTNQPGDFLSGGTASSSRFLDLDPNNIDKVDVLKGLSASVLYGEKGRNGVILITTKNGRSNRGDRFEINVNQSVFASQIASLPTYQPSYGNGFQQNYGPFFSNWGPSFTQLDSVPHPYGHYSDPALTAAFPEYAGKKVKYQAYPNSAKDFFRTGMSYNTSLNINGAKDNLNYNVTFGRTKEEGFIPNNTLEKVNFGAGINANLTKKFNIATSVNYASTNLATPPISAGNGSGIAGGGESVYSDILYTPVNVDLMHLPFESPVDHRSVYYRTGNDIQNPRWTAKYTKQTDDVRRFYGNTGFNYNITNELRATYRIGLDTYSETQEYIVNKGGPQMINGYYRTSDIQNTIWNHDFLLSYNHQFGTDLSLTATVGAQNRYDVQQRNGMSSTNQIVFGFINHNNFTAHSNVDALTGNNLNYQTKNRYQGAYGTATLGYKDYLYLNIQGRNDWSSTLEKKYQSIAYPSASLSFVPTTAFSNLESDTFNYLKLRAGYGTSAGFPTPYSTRSYLNTTARSFLDKTGSVITANSISDTYGNANLKPELFKEVEFGVDAKFFQNRFGFEATFYNRVSSNLITNAPLDPSTGYTATSINVGKITNKGIELAVTGTPVILGDFRWDMTLNFYHYTSIVNSLAAGLAQTLIPGGGYSNLGNFAIPGMPFGTIQGSYVERDANGNLLVGADGNYIASKDIKPIGNPNPQFTSSIITNFTYKGLTLSAQFDYRKGGKIYSTTQSTLLARGTSKDADFNHDATFILPGVKEDGTKNDIQLTSSDLFFNNYGFGPSELQVYDGTTVRLNQVSLSYQLPKALISKTPFKGISISLVGQNLWFKAVNFPKYSHFDTNQLSTGVGNGQGLDFLTGPSSKKYGATLGLKF